MDDRRDPGDVTREEVVVVAAERDTAIAHTADPTLIPSDVNTANSTDDMGTEHNMVDSMDPVDMERDTE